MAKKNKSIDLFGEDEQRAEPTEFEALLNSSAVRARGLSVGDRFRGEVLAVSGQEAFIATGTPTDAVMPLIGGPNAVPPKTGDMIDVLVVRAREGEILVRDANQRGGSGGAEADSLEDAFDMELPVEGTVLEAVKGGFRVKVQAAKAFCPISQMDLRVTDANEYVGKKYEFIITRFEKGRDLVISRRKLLEQERAMGEGEFLKTAEVGGIYTGTIFRIEKYGAFVRLGDGIEGLIPISELSWGRLGHPQEVVNLDQTVQVKLLRMGEEDGRLRVSFSLKEGGAVADPWSTIAADYPVGTQIEGTVEHKEAFGLFVNIALGVTGLLPRSAWRDSGEAAQFENRRRGDKVRVQVERVDVDNHRLSFGLPRELDDETWREHDAATGKKSQANFGTLGDLLKGFKAKS